MSNVVRDTNGLTVVVLERLEIIDSLNTVDPEFDAEGDRVETRFVAVSHCDVDGDVVKEGEEDGDIDRGGERVGVAADEEDWVKRGECVGDNDTVGDVLPRGEREEIKDSDGDVLVLHD